MSESKRNMAVSLFFLVLSVVFWVLVDVGVRHSSTFSGNSPMLDSHFFPKFIAVLLGLSSLSCLLGSAWSLRRERKTTAPGVLPPQPPPGDALFMPVEDGMEEEREERSWRSEFRVVGMLCLFLAYALLFKPIGYLAATVVISTAVLALLGCRTWWYYPVSWAFGAIVYYAFTELLYVPLP